ncbi:MAG: alpha/beta fold hydrolase [Actinomycetota bacterium]
MRPRALVLALCLATAMSGVPAGAQEQVGTAFPKGFPVIIDHSLGVPVLGFGGDGRMRRTPVIFLHGNNDTPYATDCNSTFGKIQAFAQYFADHGYRPSELWALGYQGDQCDLQTDQSKRASVAHTATANVPDLRRFVRAVLRYTGARQVDIIGHSLGSTLAREWIRQDRSALVVRRFVGVDGPEHGIINCSPSPRNYYFTIGFDPDSPVCQEFGSDGTSFLRRLNRRDETVGPTRYMTIANGDVSFVYIDKQDGVFAPVPAEDREGRPHDFSRSARLRGAHNVVVTGQGVYDDTLLTAHLGIVNSPEVWSTALKFLSGR